HRTSRPFRANPSCYRRDVHSFPTRRSSDLGPIQIVLDGQSLDEIAMPPDRSPVWVNRVGDEWTVVNRPEPTVKGPHRYGSIKSRSEEHTSELQSREDLVCRLLLETKKEIEK